MLQTCFYAIFTLSKGVNIFLLPKSAFLRSKTINPLKKHLKNAEIRRFTKCITSYFKGR